MCQLFINADTNLWISKTRSLRIDGVVTSVRLENFFWDILEEVAHRDGMSSNQLITKLYMESMDADHDIGNFSSFLRVCCGRYLSLSSDGALIRNEQTPLEGIDAQSVLTQEQHRMEQRQLERNRREQPRLN